MNAIRQALEAAGIEFLSLRQAPRKIETFSRGLIWGERPRPTVPALDQTIAKLKPRLIDENLSGEKWRPLLAFLARAAAPHTASPSALSTMPGKGPATSEPAKPCAAVRVRRLGDLPTSICAVTATSSPPTVEHRAASAMPTITLELTERADALALGKLSTADHNQNRPPSNARSTSASLPPLPKAAHPQPFADQRAPCGGLRSATLLPPGRHDRCRPQSPIGGRLPPRPTPNFPVKR